MALKSAARVAVRFLPLIVTLALLAPPVAGQGMSSVAEVRSLDVLRGATLANTEEDIGKIDDLLLDLSKGTVTSLIVAVNTSSGRRTVEVPYELVTWSDASRSFLVDMPRDELDEMPRFRPEAVELFDESRMPEGLPPGMTPPMVASGSMLATELSGLKTRFLGGAEDKLRGVWIELFTGQVAFVVVSRVEGGAAMANLHPLPWNAFRVFGTTPAPERDPVPEATLRVDRERLTEAPSLANGALDDARFRMKVYGFHHVPKPRFETLN